MKKNFLLLNILHIFNDGYETSFLLLLPFIAKELHINLAQVGILTTTEKVFTILLSLPAVYVAMKFGGLKTILFSLFVYCTGFLLTGFASSFFIIFLTFIVAGIGFGFFNSIGYSLAAQWSEKSSLGKNIGNYSATGDIGRIILPAVMTFIIAFIGWRHTSLLYAGAGILAFFLLLKSILSQRELFHKTTKQNIHIPIFKLIKNKLYIFANLANMTDNIASSSLYVYLPFLLLHKGINPAFLGIVIACYFIGTISGKTVLGIFSDRFGSSTIFMLSEICMAILILILANSNSIFLISTASLVLGIFTKGTLPIAKTMITESVEEHAHLQKAFGVNVTFASGATALGALILGLIANSYGIVSAFNISALFAILAIIPALFFKLEKKNVILS